MKDISIIIDLNSYTDEFIESAVMPFVAGCEKLGWMDVEKNEDNKIYATVTEKIYVGITQLFSDAEIEVVE